MIRKDHLNIDSQRQRQDRHEMCSVQCQRKLILRASPHHLSPDLVQHPFFFFICTTERPQCLGGCIFPIIPELMWSVPALALWGLRVQRYTILNFPSN